MTENELKILGFVKEDILDDSNGDYYYYLQIVDGLSLISNSRDEKKDEEWFVDVFNTDPTIRFHKMEQVQSLVNILTRSIVRNDTKQ
jgi:hypothetical protein